MIEIEPGCVAENAVQRIVEVCRDHHSAFTPGHLEDLVIGRPGKPDRRRVNRVVARTAPALRPISMPAAARRAWPDQSLDQVAQ